MAGVSRKAGNQNVRHGWRSRMGVSLMVGLVFFLCAKASVREEEEMRLFLLRCGMASEERNAKFARITKDTNLGALKQLTINVVEASKMPIPDGWGAVLKELETLMFTGMMCEADGNVRQASLSEKEMQTLELMSSRVKEVPTLTYLSFDNMRMADSPNGSWMAVSPIILLKVICRSTSIPMDFKAEHMHKFAVNKFVCDGDGNGLLRLIHGMPNIRHLRIENSNIGDATSFGKKLFLGELRSLSIKELEKEAIEELIKCVEIGGLRELRDLEIEKADLGGLEIPETMKLPKLEKLTLAFTKTKSLENVKTENFPCLESLGLQGNSDLRLDENMCKCELFQKITHLEVEVQACENIDIGTSLSNLESVIFYEGGVEIMKTGCIGESKEKLRVVLNAKNIREEDVENLQILHENTCEEMEVVIPTEDQTQLSEKWGEQLIRMTGRCKHLERFSLDFGTRQENLCALKLVQSLEDINTFEFLNVFEVKGVSADRTVGLGMNWTKDSTGVEGIWNGEEWEVEYLPKTLKFHSMENFEEWLFSDEKEGKLITKKGNFKRTRGPSMGEFTTECAMCDKTFEEYAAAEWFIVLDCGDWICVDCTEHMYKAEHGEQLALSTKIGQVVELECSSCGDVFEYVIEQLPDSPQESHRQIDSD
jgi:hypothetical protein